MAESLERVDPTLVKVNIEIKWEDFKKKYVESIRKVGGSLRIRGFRPGKAPLSILEKLYGQEVMMEAAVESVSSKLKELMKKEKLFLVKEDFDVRENVVIEERKQVRYSKELEVLPELEQLDFKEIELEEKKQVDEKDVEKAIFHIAARKAPVSNRPAAEASTEYDIVVVSGRISFEDEKLDPLELKDEKVDLAPWTNYKEENTELFVGKKAGDKIKQNVGFPLTKGTPESIPAKIDCKINSILKRDVPAIDDELAKDFDFDNLEDMKKDIRKQIDKDIHEAWIERSGDRIIESLVGKYDVPLPLSYKGLVEEKLGSAQETKGKEDREKLKLEYEKEFKKFILTQVIALQNGLQVPVEELQKNMEAVRKMLQRMKMEESRKQEFLKNWLREYEMAQFYKLVNGFVVEKVLASSESAPAEE